MFDNIEQRIEGKIIVRSFCPVAFPLLCCVKRGRTMGRMGANALWQGFDEFMNVVLDDSEEIWIKETKTKKLGARNSLGRSSFPVSRREGMRA